MTRLEEYKLPIGPYDFALIDLEDLPKLSKYRWYVRMSRKLRYAYASIKINGEWASVFLHRFLTNAPKGMDVDHINGDPQNYR